MPVRVKVAVVVLAAIFAGLAILLLIAHIEGDGGTDSNNSDVSSNT
jgi:hypothetical protein